MNINNKTIKYVEKVTYLGQLISIVIRFEQILEFEKILLGCSQSFFVFFNSKTKNFVTRAFLLHNLIYIYTYNLLSSVSS